MSRPLEKIDRRVVGFSERLNRAVNSAGPLMSSLEPPGDSRRLFGDLATKEHSLAKLLKPYGDTRPQAENASQKNFVRTHRVRSVD